MSYRLPVHCEVEYFANFLSADESQALFGYLLDTCPVTNRTIKMADGSEFEGELGSFLLADEELTPFGVIGKEWGPRLAWPPLLRDVKERVEGVADQRFGVCRSVYYEDGAAGIDFHHDPPAFGPTNCIASISLGEEREFVLRNKQDHSDQCSLILENGSLVIMGEGCQERYEHAIPRSERYTNPRLNLTFRIYEPPASDSAPR